MEGNVKVLSYLRVWGGESNTERKYLINDKIDIFVTLLREVKGNNKIKDKNDITVKVKKNRKKGSTTKEIIFIILKEANTHTYTNKSHRRTHTQSRNLRRGERKQVENHSSGNLK